MQHYKNVPNVLQEKLFCFISENLKYHTPFACEVKSNVCEYIGELSAYYKSKAFF